MGSNPVWRITLPSVTDRTSHGVRIPQPTVTSVVHSLGMPHGHGASWADSRRCSAAATIPLLSLR